MNKNFIQLKQINRNNSKEFKVIFLNENKNIDKFNIHILDTYLSTYQCLRPQQIRMLC